MSTFVLVHGSWHDGSAWKAVIQDLEAKGHQVFAPTIAGHGQGVNKNVNHAQCTQSIVDYIVSKDLTDIILLGHSFGGTIIAKVAEAIPDRIRRLIFFAAPQRYPSTGLSSVIRQANERIGRSCGDATF
jgi:pimeloyl-ACP methyl ester carboxylesterase